MAAARHATPQDATGIVTRRTRSVFDRIGGRDHSENPRGGRIRQDVTRERIGQAFQPHSHSYPAGKSELGAHPRVSMPEKRGGSRSGRGGERGAVGAAAERRSGWATRREGWPEHHGDGQRQVEHDQSSSLVEVPELASRQQGCGQGDQLGETFPGRRDHRPDHDRQVSDQHREPEARIHADPETR